MHQNNSSEFYLKNNWIPNYDIFTYSGWALKDKIKTNDQILDIGCGYNLFKEHFGSRIYGIDPYNNKADQLISWEDYKLHKEFNVFFILGSFNFGDEKYVESQIAKLSKGVGLFIISTKEGLLTNHLCLKRKIGGAALCYLS